MKDDTKMFECSCGKILDLSYMNESSEHFLTCNKFKLQNHNLMSTIHNLVSSANNQTDLLITKILFNKMYSETFNKKPRINGICTSDINQNKLNTSVTPNPNLNKSQPKHNNFIPNDDDNPFLSNNNTTHSNSVKNGNHFYEDQFNNGMNNGMNGNNGDMLIEDNFDFQG